MKAHRVTTCKGDFMIFETEDEVLAVSTTDEDCYYHLPSGISDDEIKNHFINLIKFEN